jgi:hypothetical protein
VLVCHAHVPPYIIALLRLPPLAKADLHALCPIDLLLKNDVAMPLLRARPMRRSYSSMVSGMS